MRGPDAGERPKVTVTLENSQGETKTVSVEDEWLVENKLDIGSEWPEDTEEEKTK